VDLPSNATTAAYRDAIVSDYPFHPELLTTLNRKTSTIPNFQKTRGVLRLLARVIRELWTAKPKGGFLVCLHDLNLGVEAIANDLTSRLDRPQFKQVIEADIISPRLATPSHAQEVDAEWTGAGKPPYAQRIATSIFLHSLVQTGQSGAKPGELRLAVLQPDDDPALIDQAVHAEDMTEGAAMRLMMDGTFQEEREAAGKWVRAQLTSAQLSTYFVGYLEHASLRREVEAARGTGFDLKKYHDGVLSFGSPPMQYVRALMLDLPFDRAGLRRRRNRQRTPRRRRGNGKTGQDQNQHVECQAFHKADLLFGTFC
jgi:hypothetical protein